MRRYILPNSNIQLTFASLKTSLRELGLNFEAKPSWDICDKEYANLCDQLQNTDFDVIVQKPPNEESSIMSMGAVFIEALSAAFWSNGLLVQCTSYCTIFKRN